MSGQVRKLYYSLLLIRNSAKVTTTCWFRKGNDVSRAACRGKREAWVLGGIA